MEMGAVARIEMLRSRHAITVKTDLFMERKKGKTISCFVRVFANNG